MPRNPQSVTRQKLEAALANWSRTKAAERRARKALEESMVKAVESGVPRYEVAKICGVSQTRVSQVDGMPKGPNARKEN